MTNENKMTPTQALEVLEKATGLLQLNRADHQVIVNALKVLVDFVDKNSDKE
jgi:hypothetical protein